MKTITIYKCEICGNEYRQRDPAEICEQKGRPDATIYPRGMIFGNASRGFYKGITFVVDKVEVARDCKHYLQERLWAFRDTCAGDSRYLHDVCGSGNFFMMGKADVPDRKHPTFRRAVEFLRRYGIPPTVWDGSKAVPLDAEEI
jgi:hypothetical protein